MATDNICVMCGESVPEGREVCPKCERGRKRMTLEKAIELLKAEYERAKTLKYVIDPLAWALYQVWKKADEER